MACLITDNIIIEPVIIIIINITEALSYCLLYIASINPSKKPQTTAIIDIDHNREPKVKSKNLIVFHRNIFREI
jgi:hypothetical protein